MENNYGGGMSKPNNFDVLKEMGKRNLDIRLFPLENFVAAKTHSLGGQVTWGVNRDTIMDLLANKQFCGGLILADKTQFDALAKELEEEDTLRPLREAMEP